MNGVVLINKPTNFTSRDIVNIISKKLKTKKVGHTGTLDPMASGVLVICVGTATKLVDILTSTYKEYIATIRLGVLTDTLDSTGNIIEEKDAIINKEDINNALLNIKGKYIQEVPIYSAVKVNGKKLYEYARENIDVILPKREVDIKEIELLAINHDDNKTDIKIRCLVSKGTYIRALANDIAKQLNNIGIMTSLIRTKQGDFDIQFCQTLEEVYDNNFISLPIEYILKEYFKVEMDENLRFKVLNGCKIDNKYDKDVVLFTYENKAVSLYKDDNGVLKSWKYLGK